MPEGVYTVISIDPVPPPSEKEIKQGLKKKDHEVILALGKKGKDYFLLEYAMKNGHFPTWTIAEFFRMVRKWKPVRTVVESVAYQRTLAWLLRTAMETQNIWVPVIEYTDKRPKSVRIISALSGISSYGHLWIRREHVDFISQFVNYPNVPHDDILDALAIAISEINMNIMGEEEESLDEILKSEKSLPRLNYRRGAP